MTKFFLPACMLISCIVAPAVNAGSILILDRTVGTAEQRVSEARFLDRAGAVDVIDLDNVKEGVVKGREWSRRGVKFSQPDGGELALFDDSGNSNFTARSPFNALLPRSADAQRIELRIDPPTHAVGFWLIDSELNHATETIQFYDANDRLLMSTLMPITGYITGDATSNFFVGLLSSVPVARVLINEGALDGNETVGVDHVYLGTEICFCGDGILQPDLAELCDDGNNQDGDCCSSDCTAPAPVGQACDDGLSCTIVDSCNAIGLCKGELPDGCDDGDPCTQDSCDMGGCINAERPAPVCMPAGRGLLDIVDKTGVKKDQLVWKWKQGCGFSNATLGRPEVDSEYALCAYEHSGFGAPFTHPAHESTVLLGGTIAPGATWLNKAPNGYKYKDRNGDSLGIVTGLLKTGADRKSKIELLSKGVNLPMPATSGDGQFFDPASTITVQLSNGAGVCWSADFDPSTVKKNAADRFKAELK